MKLNLKQIMQSKQSKTDKNNTDESYKMNTWRSIENYAEYFRCYFQNKYFHCTMDILI